MGVTHGHGIGVPPPNKTAERWPVTSPCDVFTCCGILFPALLLAVLPAGHGAYRRCVQRLSLYNSLSPSRSCDAWYGVWRRSTLRLYVSWNFVFGAIIIGFYHWGGLCVVCSSCHRSAVQVGEDMLTGGYVLNGLHPRLLSIRTYGALPGCFVLAGHGDCGVGKLRRSDGAQPWV